MYHILWNPSKQWTAEDGFFYNKDIITMVACKTIYKVDDSIDIYNFYHYPVDIKSNYDFSIKVIPGYASNFSIHLDGIYDTTINEVLDSIYFYK